jgi:hypothetical protein
MAMRETTMKSTSRASTALPPLDKKFELTMTVSTEAQARELQTAWREIVAGKQPRTEALERDEIAITARALAALRIIETAIRENPTTGQAGRLVRFLAGVYNGSDFPFDLTDLRALDTRLANACLDYLNYDRLAKREVHHHLSGGDRELHEWFRSFGLLEDEEERTRGLAR